jgi:hypothetical protein
MAYDESRGVIVFFGGEIGKSGSESYFNDTWEYDGVHWTQMIITNVVPSPRSFHAMAYDGAGGIILYGGQAGGDAYQDTWVYHHDNLGPRWEEYFGPRPGQLAGHAMVYDSQQKLPVILGGANRVSGSGSFASSDMIWLGTPDSTWTNVGIFPSTHGAYYFGAAFDSLRNTIVGVGGYDTETDLVAPQYEAWKYGPTNYDFSNLIPGPSPRSGASVAYDTNRDRIVCVGGDNGLAGTEEDVQEYSPDTGWYVGTPLPSGMGRAGAAMVYDPARKVMVLMGGAGAGAPNGNDGGRFDDTWELVPATAPTITFPPSGQLCRNSHITYTPTVSANRTLTYQWYVAGSQGWMALPGETNQTLDVPAPISWTFNYFLGAELEDDYVRPGGQTLLMLMAKDSCGSPYSVTGAVNIVAPPLNTPDVAVFSDPPATNDVDGSGQFLRCVGDSITLHDGLVYAGNVTNFTCQWYRSGTPIGPGIVDLFDEPEITLNNLQRSDTGDYYVRITNPCGTCESPHVHLQVGVTISVQPPNQNVNPCQPANFSVTASGIGTLHYQWRYQGVPLTNDSFHTGVTNSTLTVSPTLYDLEGDYDVVVWDDCGLGQSITSVGAKLTLPPPIWILRTTNGPSARYGNQMVYDSKRNVHVMYGGGQSVFGVGYRGLGEVWEWNGLHWRQRTTYNTSNAWHQVAGGIWQPIYGDTPPARMWHSMAYDSQRGRVVMFGGRGGPDGVSGDYFFNDTWEWDGSQWYFRGTNGPPASIQAEMAYDANRGVTVLAGGFPPSPTQVWEWDGTNWSSHAASLGSGDSYNQVYGGMTYDANLHQVFFGPTADGFSVRFFWSWDGLNWISRGYGFNALAYAPPYGAMTFDTYRNLDVYFGGQNGYSGYYGGNTTAFYGGGTWSVMPGLSPALVDNDFIGLLSLVSKLTTHADPVSLYLWNSLSPTTQGIISDGSSPPTQKRSALETDLNAVISGASIYDTNRFAGVVLSPETVMLRGINPQGPELARFNRLLIEDVYTAEIARSLSVPAGRMYHGLSFDPPRRAMVMMGGQYDPGSGKPLGNETWELIRVDKPVMVQQPPSQFRAIGDTAVFTVAAAAPVGSTLQYQWYFGNQALSNGGRISGAQSSVLRITNVQPADVGLYHATVADNCATINTAPAVLTTDSRLQIFSLANSTQLVWSDPNLVLEQSDSLSGPWTQVLGASSPFDLTVEAPSRFFRLNTPP